MNASPFPHVQVAKKLVMFTPEPALVDAYLAEIAKGYGVKWTPPASNDSDDTGDEGGAKVSLNAARLTPCGSLTN